MQCSAAIASSVSPHVAKKGSAGGTISHAPHNTNIANHPSPLATTEEENLRTNLVCATARRASAALSLSSLPRRSLTVNTCSNYVWPSLVPLPARHETLPAGLVEQSTTVDGFRLQATRPVCPFRSRKTMLSDGHSRVETLRALSRHRTSLSHAGSAGLLVYRA